ncbi:MAG: hypothetical protein ACPGVO_02800 [Spirulinaceae cyanobacterium]
MPDETQQPSTDFPAATLAQIRAVIQDLEVLASRLAEAESEANSGAAIAPPPALDTLTNAVADLVDALGTDAQKTKSADDTTISTATEAATRSGTADAGTADSETADSETAKTETDDWLDDSEPASPAQPPRPNRLAQLRGLWAKVLQGIRLLLPGNVRQKLPDPVLTAIVAGVIVFALWLPGALTREPMPEPTAPEPTAIKPMPDPVSTSPAAPQTSPAPPPTIQPQPTAPQIPAKPTPPLPPQRLTPEQNLIAAIQEQVAQITDQYAEGLIQSLQVDFLAGRLRVVIGADWYDLSGDRQDQVASEVLSRARRLDFTKVEMIDENELTLARSPVIGDQMIIFQREPLGAKEVGS